ncbi:MAG: homogentisate phytyltransferase [Solirubrobacteraceae bacterium]|nr:homogentisate phytyltransferase [Solirubrobacteraceae bacterium]
MSRPPVALRRSSPRAAAWALRLLWRFGRPHTLIGTSLSIVGLYVIAASLDRASDAVDLLWTLLAGLCVNVFITGINQVEDVEIDRLNKPWLPIAAGDLSLEAARRIVAVAAIAPLVMAATQGAEELVAVGVALLVGWAYSCPPLRLKRYAALAAGSITFVRSLVVNLGVWLHIAGRPVSAGVWALIAVTVPFSFAIAVLKDVPDIEGDRRFGIATFSVRLGPRPVLAAGVGALTLGGLGMAVAGPLLLDGANAAVLVVGHLLGVAALWRWALRVDPADPVAFAAFYQRVWQLFFCEYLLVPLAYVVG